LVAYPRFQIPLNPPFLKWEISHNDLDGTTIKAAKIYKTGGLEIKDTLKKCQQENEGCPPISEKGAVFFIKISQSDDAARQVRCHNRIPWLACHHAEGEGQFGWRLPLPVQYESFLYPSQWRQCQIGFQSRYKSILSAEVLNKRPINRLCWAILSYIGVWTMKKFNSSKVFVINAVMSIKIKYYIDF
jgi:hypothetical protein